MMNPYAVVRHSDERDDLISLFNYVQVRALPVCLSVCLCLCLCL